MSRETEREAARARFNALAAIPEAVAANVQSRSMDTDTSKQSSSKESSSKTSSSKTSSSMLGQSFSSCVSDFVHFAFLATTAFLLGSMGFGVAVVVGGALVYVWVRARQRSIESQRLFYERLVREGEASTLTHCYSSLPSWVRFPEQERVEWLNVLLVKLWPHLNKGIESLLKNQVEPQIRAVLRSYNVYGFAFSEVDLGEVSPRIEGVIVTPIPKDERLSSELLLDLHLVYVGDLRLGISVMGVGASIESIVLKTRLRVILKPLLPALPLVGGLQVTMPQMPDELDFELGGAVSFLDLPVLAHILREVIKEQLAAYLVAPNKICIGLSDLVSPADLIMPSPKGVLALTILQAEELVKADKASRNDVYCLVRHGASVEERSEMAKGCDPKWPNAQSMLFVSEHPDTDELVITLMDEDKLSNDDFLGSTSIAMRTLADNKAQIERYFRLEGVEQGSIRLRLAWFNVVDRPQLSSYHTLIEDKNKPSALLTLFIDSCRLKNTEKKDINLKLRLVDNQNSTLNTKESQIVSSVEGKVQEGFVFTLKGRVDQLSLKLELVSRQTLMNERVEGSSTLFLTSMLNDNCLKLHQRDLMDEDVVIGQVAIAVTLLFLEEPELRRLSHLEAAHVVGQSARKMAKGVVGASFKSFGSVTQGLGHRVGNRVGNRFRALRAKRNDNDNEDDYEDNENTDDEEQNVRKRVK